MIKFEKVSESRFIEDTRDSLMLNIDDPTVKSKTKMAYDMYVSIPRRSTYGSCGYDFVSPVGVTIEPGDKKVVPTGIRVAMDSSKFLMIVPRSSLGFKYQIGLANTVGIIDSDYYEADNEGHIMLALENRGKKTVEIGAGDRVAQGIFLTYFTADDEDDLFYTRTGGFGSTGK